VAFLLVACGRTRQDVATLTVDDGAGPVTVALWARQGFVEMVPALRPPTTADRADRIEVWMKLPEGAVIETRWAPDQERWVLVMPEGAVVDRVEQMTPAGGASWVADVRGTEFLGGGHEQFHVLRRAGPRLTGFSWPRDGPAAQREATDLLGALLRRQGADGPWIRKVTALNDCAQCHRHEKPESTLLDEGGVPHRATDASGLFVPTAVLSSRAPIETARPWDQNLDDPFIRFRCPSGEPRRVERGSGAEAARFLRCPGGAVPIGELDVRAALAAGDTHATAVCASRRYLFEHLDGMGRTAFAEALAECPP
jgi:hypothetical protein